MKTTTNRVIRYLFVVTSLALTSGQAHSVLVVTAEFNLGGAVQVTDNMTGDSNSAVGIVDAIFSDGTSEVKVFAVSEAPDALLVDIQTQARIASGTSGTVQVTDNGYLTTTSPSYFTSNVGVSFVGSINGPSGLDVDVTTKVNNDVVLTANDLTSGVGQTDLALVAIPTDPFQFTITHSTVFNNTSNDERTAAFTTATAIPEPSVVALLGVGLVGFGFARRRNRSTTAS